MNRLIRIAVAAAAVLVVPVTLGSTQAFALDRHIMLINDSHETIKEFYASNVGSDSWEEDILGRDVLLPGQSVRINLDDGSGYCKFDFKTVTESGAAIIRRGINVCQVETYTIHD